DHGFASVRASMVRAVTAVADISWLENKRGRPSSRPLSFQAKPKSKRSVAPRDIDGLVPVTPGNRDGLGAAAGNIGPVGRRDIRRIAMGPIPGKVLGIGVMDIVRFRRLRRIDNWRAIRSVVEAADGGPDKVPAVVPERMATCGVRNRTRAGNARALGASGPRERLVR